MTTKHKRKPKKDNLRLRQAIAMEAAKMMYCSNESEYFTAKRKAARQLGFDYRYKMSDLPSNKEIRQEILRMADFYEKDARQDKLLSMRLYALWIMQELSKFSPRLVGSTFSGHIREGSDIDLHLFAGNLSSVCHVLDEVGLPYNSERKRVVKFNQEKHFNHIHLHGKYEIEITVYPLDLINYRFKCSITGKAMKRATLNEFVQFLQREYPNVDLEAELQQVRGKVETYEMFKMLLLPLEEVDGGIHHPEGSTLYHSLQVFELARKWHGYDLEFLQAALFHDVGKAIDPRHHAEVGAHLLEGFVSERVLFLIRHHMDALALRKGKLGHKKKVLLQNSPYFEDLLTLRKLDDQGREPGAIVDTAEEALAYLHKLEIEEY